MPPKKKMTAEEREEMIRQMDKDLEEFIMGKIEENKKIPKEPFNYAKVEEELMNHPAFIKEWDPSKPMSPEMEALIDLKYNAEDDTERATNYKEDGNHNFKKSKYRWAIDNYTEAIKCKSPDKLVNAVCYTNRAAAQFRLANYRSSFRDVVFARKFVPDHMKAIVRGVECCMKICQFDIAQRWIDEGLLLDSSHEKLLTLRKENDQLKKVHERNVRKKKAKERKENEKRKRLLEAIRSRSITLKGVNNEEVDPSDLSIDEEDWNSLFGPTANSEAANARVFVDDYDTLHWPLLLMYPEYGQTDLISQANETTRLCDLLYQVFGPETPPADWDIGRKYNIDSLQVYFEDRDKEALYLVDTNVSIKFLLSQKQYVVYGGLPTIIVLVKDEKFTTEFLNKYHVM